jgi:hypothetical protein
MGFGRFFEKIRLAAGDCQLGAVQPGGCLFDHRKAHNASHSKENNVLEMDDPND